MGWGSFFSSLFGGGGGSLVDEIVVESAKSGGGKALGSALGSGIGQGLAQGFGGGIGGAAAGAGGGAGPTEYYWQEADGSLTPYDGPSVDQLTVEAQGGGGGLDLGNLPADFSGLSSGALGELLGGAGAVSPLEVFAPQASQQQLAASNPVSIMDPGVSNLMASMGALAPMAMPDFASINPQPELSALEVMAPGSQALRLDSVTPSAALSGLQGLGAVPTYEDVYGAPREGGGGIGKDEGLLAMLGLGGVGGLLKAGLGLLPAAMMLDKISDAQKAANQAGQQNQQQQQQAIDGLKGQIAGNAPLLSALQNRTLANMEGKIGGEGMNAISRAVRAAQARIRSKYHQMGMSGSTMEDQDLQAAAQQGVETQFKMAQDMAGQGLEAISRLTGQNMDAWARILQAQMLQGTALGNASASFAAASSTALGGLMGGVWDQVKEVL